MDSRQGRRRIKRAGAGLAAAAVAGTGMIAVAPASGAAASTPAAAGAGAGAGEQCQVVELAMPPGAHETSVMDIEVVDGQTIYYGSYHIREEDGLEHQRAVIWRGLDGAPEPLDVGLGRRHDVAFELTETGLVNGQSEDWPERAITPWVMDLATGEVTTIDTASGAGADGSEMFVRRINDAGAVVGTDSAGRGAAKMGRAMGWEHYSADPFRLDAKASASWAFGINNLGDRVGRVEKDRRAGFPHWVDFTPTLWAADGSTRELARVGIDAVPWLIKDDRSAAGEGWWGWSAEVGHVEAVYWPSFDEAVGLGVVDGGAWSRAFGMDEGGWVVGGFDQFTGPPPVAPDAVTDHGFLYRHGVTTPGHVRVLPSLHAVENGLTNWRDWQAVPVHGVNAELDQAASGTHAGYTEDGRPIWSATVWVNASSCGVEVETTHDPWHLTDLESAREVSAEIDENTVSP